VVNTIAYGDQLETHSVELLKVQGERLFFDDAENWKRKTQLLGVQTRKVEVIAVQQTLLFDINLFK